MSAEHHLAADALKHEERCGIIPAIGDKVRTARSDRIGIPRAKPHLLLRFAQEQPDPSLDDVERILNIAVEMPRHLLRRRDLKLADAETRPLCMTNATLYLIKMARIFDWLHRFLHLWGCSRRTIQHTDPCIGVFKTKTL